jgi:hypothetical protein
MKACDTRSRRTRRAKLLNTEATENSEKMTAGRIDRADGAGRDEGAANKKAVHVRR